MDTDPAWTRPKGISAINVAGIRAETKREKNSRKKGLEHSEISKLVEAEGANSAKDPFDESATEEAKSQRVGPCSKKASIGVA